MLDMAMLSAVALYMVSSAGMTIFNKLAVRALRVPITLTMIQMLFTVAVLLAVPAWRASLQFSSYGAWRWARAIPPLFAAMLVSECLG